MKRYFLIGCWIIAILVAANVMSFASGFFKVGESAPNFTLTSLDEQSVSLESLRGNVVVLGLFHICEPCLIQGTNLQKVAEAMRGKNVAVVGVNSSGDSKEHVMEFLKTFPVPVTYPYLLDPEQVTDQLFGGGKFIPNVYIIDQQGVIRWQRVGNFNMAGDDIILQEVEKLLANHSSASAL
ncbi:MAG: hypothetical protein NPIRA02_10320 [Nitrospirales bacterium]|nr:MAG: hypothetical protein NPIRA02_10320 [Nitrospirales bacterium]